MSLSIFTTNLLKINFTSYIYKMAQQLPLPMDMREQLLRTIVYQHKMISHLKELEHKPFFSKKYTHFF